MNFSETLSFFRRPASLLALLAALVALLAGWFLPWRPIIAGEEQLGPEKAAQSRQALAPARERFETAQSHYQSYVKSHDMGALLDRSRSALSEAKADPSSPDKLTTVRDQAAQVADYAGVLRDYAEAGDAYLTSLRQYDDNLMNWTRGLFAASESLRSETWPFVEHLKLYPTPIGEKTDPPLVPATEVSAQLAALQDHVAALSPDPNPPTGSSVAAALGAIGADIDEIWASGRSVEYVASLHPEYDRELSTYDAKVQAAAGDPQSTQISGARRLVAPALTAALGLIMLVGLAALFSPRREARR